MYSRRARAHRPQSTSFAFLVRVRAASPLNKRTYPRLGVFHRRWRFFNLAKLKMDFLGHLRETLWSLSLYNTASATN